MTTKETKRIPFFLLLILTFPFSIHSQVTFERMYTNTFGDDEAADGCQLLSSNYGILSTIYSCGPCTEFGVYKVIDSSGNVLYQNTFALNQDAKPEILHKGNGDTVLAAGVILNYDNQGYNIFLKKFDPQAHLIWEKEYVADSLSDIEPRAICNTQDGGYFINYVSWSEGIHFFKINSNGDSLFTKKYLYPFHGGTSMTELHDKGFALLGTKYLSSGILEFSILRMDSLADTLWSKSFQRDTIGILSQIIETSDHGFLALGNLIDTPNTYQMCLIKFDSLANFQWVKSIRHSKTLSFYELQPCTNGGYIVAGVLMDHIANSSTGFLYRANEYGDSVWLREYNPLYASGLASVRQTSDNGFIAAGSIGYQFLGYTYLIKTDSLGNITSTLTVPDLFPAESINIFPNPSSGLISIYLTGAGRSNVCIYDMRGLLLLKKDYTENLISIDARGFAKGVYLIKINRGSYCYQEKLILSE